MRTSKSFIDDFEVRISLKKFYLKENFAKQKNFSKITFFLNVWQK